MNRKATIIELHKQGISPNDIATILDVSKRYVYRCIEPIKEANRQLTVSNYIKAVERGYDTKEGLARFFHVAKKKLFEFEKEHDILQLLAKYYYIKGKSLPEIGQILHMRIGSIQIPPDFPTLDEVRRDLNTILDIYGKMAEHGDAETVRYNDLKRIVGKL